MTKGDLRTMRQGAVRASASLRPALLLVAALSSVFWFGHDRGYFYRSNHAEAMGSGPSLHNWASSKNLALAANLSWRSGFQIFFSQHKTADGVKRDYYGSFPVGGYALIKAAIAPFADDLAAMILAARLLMLALFCAAALLAYDAIAKILGCRWTAATAVALAFSSYYCLYHNDAVDNEGSPDMFAVMLAFHGMVEFARRGRLGQLLAKTAVAVFLGWHVFAFILPFAVAGLYREFRDVHRAGGGLRTSTLAIVRSGYLVAACWAVGVGLVPIAFNVLHQWVGPGGEANLGKLQVVHSALGRTGLTDRYVAGFEWWPFLQVQFHRVGQFMALPAAFSAPLTAAVSTAREAIGVQFDFFGVLGMVATAGALAALVAVQMRARRRGSRRPVWLLGVLAISGFCWALLVRGSYMHDHESLYYIGLTLVLFSFAALALRCLGGGKAVKWVAVLAAGTFVLSAYQMGLVGHDAEGAERQRALARDFEAISSITRGKYNVCVSPRSWGWFRRRYDRMEPYFAVSYFLAGSNIVITPGRDVRRCKRNGLTHYVVSFRRHREGGVLLTPNNELAFLHRSLDLEKSFLSEYREITSAKALCRSVWDGYFKDGRLYMVKEDCDAGDQRTKFWLAVIPPRPWSTRVLPAHRQRFGSLNFGLGMAHGDGVRFDGKCMVSTALPPWTELVTIGDIGGSWRCFGRFLLEDRDTAG